jgi:hypothetical protein
VVTAGGIAPADEWLAGRARRDPAPSDALSDRTSSKKEKNLLVAEIKVSISHCIRGGAHSAACLRRHQRGQGRRRRRLWTWAWHICFSVRVSVFGGVVNVRWYGARGEERGWEGRHCT